jgi:hypothetical protein
MRAQGKIKLGFFPLPIAEAKRLRSILAFPRQLSALDPCVGDGLAFVKLVEHSGRSPLRHRDRFLPGGTGQRPGY